MLILILVTGAAFAFLRYEPAKELPCIKDKVTVKGVFESYPVKTGRGMFKQTLTTKSAVSTETGESLAELYGKEVVLLSDKAFDPGTECELGIKFIKGQKRLNPGERMWDGIYANLLDIHDVGNQQSSLHSKIEG